MSRLRTFDWTQIAAPLAALFVTGLIIGIAFDQSGDFSRVMRFYTSFLIIAALLAVIALGLNIQWGYTGVLNFGVVGFFMVGAYTAAVITKDPPRSEVVTYIGGFGEALDFAPFLATDQWFIFLVGIAGAAVACGILAFLLALPMLRLREDYLAIVTIGVAEMLRRIVIEEGWLVNGTRALGGIPQPLRDVASGTDYRYVLLALSLVFLLLVFLFLERVVRSPWGRVLRGLREDELTTAASGKDVFAFKTQGFVLGAVIMGMGGAMYAFQARAISPETFTHYYGTFLIWAMLIVGGAGNNKGAILGAYVVWGFWQVSAMVQTYDMPDAIRLRIPFFRDFILGALIVSALLLMPRGLLPEERRVSIWAERHVKRLRRVPVLGSPSAIEGPVQPGGDGQSGEAQSTEAQRTE